MISVREIAGAVVACTIGAGIGLSIGLVGACWARAVAFKAAKGKWPAQFWRSPFRD